MDLHIVFRTTKNIDDARTRSLRLGEMWEYVIACDGRVAAETAMLEHAVGEKIAEGSNDGWICHYNRIYSFKHDSVVTHYMIMQPPIMTYDESRREKLRMLLNTPPEVK